MTEETSAQRLGRLLRARRKALKLTQAEVQQADGPSPATLRLIEAGKHTDFRDGTIQDERVSAREDRYVALLAKWAARDGYKLGDRKVLIKAGHDACDLLRSGSGSIDASWQVTRTYGLEGKEGLAVGVAAGEVLCPGA